MKYYHCIIYIYIYIIRIPAEFDIESAQNKYLSSFEQSYSNSMNTVLVQELIRFNGLTTVIRSSLKSILLAMKGEESMSQQLEMVIIYIYIYILGFGKHASSEDTFNVDVPFLPVPKAPSKLYQ